MKISKPILIVGVVVIIILGFFVLGTKPTTADQSQAEKLAKCLREKGVKMYGAFWCPHCNNQKQMFGSSWKNIEYVECSTPDGQGRLPICKNAGIRGYPTWEFRNGERVEGEMTFEQLAQKSGCEWKD